MSNDSAEQQSDAYISRRLSGPSKSNDDYLAVMESFMRITLAGFGGAISGIAISRGGTHTRINPGHRPYADANLPASWAIACVGFVGIIEASRVLSPFSFLGLEQRYLTTIGDYTLGGAIAGAAFRGMQVQSMKSKAPILAPRILSGLVPGIALGLVAGLAQAAADELEKKLQEEQDKINARRELELIQAEALKRVQSRSEIENSKP